ncbi:hypothetical protein FJY70_00520 [candidate division WOR-3 bacterium]|nr:hypothetical protein [candidate division WOR-3 bacterium]
MTIPVRASPDAGRVRRSSRSSPALVMLGLFVMASIGAPAERFYSRLLGSWPFDLPRSVALDTARGLAFLGAGGGVYVLDVSEPESLIKVSEGIRCADVVNGVCYRDGLLYAACAAAGLEIWDVSQPAEPRRLGVFAASGVALGVCVRDSLAFVAHNGNRLLVLSVANAEHPRELGRGSAGTVGRGVDVQDTLAFVASDNDGLRVISIADPCHPYEIGGCSTADDAVAVVVRDTLAYIAQSNKGLCIVNVANPCQPSVIGDFDTERAARGLDLVDNLIYLASTDLYVIDVNNPRHPRLSGRCNPMGAARAVKVFGGHAFAVSQEFGLRVVSVCDPSRPCEVGGFCTFYSGNDIALRAPYAYLSCEAGLAVVNVADPAFPWGAGLLVMESGAGAVALGGDYAYLADWDEGLHVVDIADPRHPVEVYYGGPWRYATDIVSRGSLLYLATDEGLSIVDVADPVAPQEIGFLETDYTPCHVAVQGDYAYVANEDEGLSIISLADSTEPRLVATCSEAADGASGLAVQGGYAFISDQDYGFSVVDIGNPSRPQVVNYVVTSGEPVGLCLQDRYLLVLVGDSGLVVYNLEQPTTPCRVSDCCLPDWPVCVAGSGRDVYVMTEGLGLQVGRLMDDRTGDRRVSCSPSARGEGSIVRGALVLGVDSRPPTAYRAELLDISGRKVMTLKPGANDVRPLAPGVYFVREECQASSRKPQAVRKVIVTR